MRNTGAAKLLEYSRIGCRRWAEFRIFVALCYSRRMTQSTNRQAAKPPLGRSETVAKLRAHEAELRRLGVEHLYLFGSTARDQAGGDSDVDLFFDHRRGELGLYQLMDVKELARKILGRPTDIMTRASLHPVLRQRIEAAALRVF